MLINTCLSLFTVQSIHKTIYPLEKQQRTDVLSPGFEPMAAGRVGTDKSTVQCRLPLI